MKAVEAGGTSDYFLSMHRRSETGVVMLVGALLLTFPPFMELLQGK
jgi:hypothetical protein